MDLGAHVEASGTLKSLHTQAKLTVDSGTLTSSGELRLSEHRGADLDVSGRHIDLRALFANAPATDLDTDATVAVFPLGSDWVAEVNGTTRPTRILDVDVPAIDVKGNYGSKGFSGHALLHEPGAPVNGDFAIHPDGAFDATAELTHVDLSRAPRLARGRSAWPTRR